MSVTVLIQPYLVSSSLLFADPSNLDFEILFSPNSTCVLQTPSFAQEGSYSESESAFICYRRVLVCAFVEVPPFFPPLLIFSLGYGIIMYNLWCRSRFLERKMYVLKRFVVVWPDHVNPTNTQCLQWQNSNTTHIAEVNLLHILYSLFFLSLSCV